MTLTDLMKVSGYVVDRNYIPAYSAIFLEVMGDVRLTFMNWKPNYYASFGSWKNKTAAGQREHLLSSTIICASASDG
jgi:hypothetical protein